MGTTSKTTQKTQQFDYTQIAEGENVYGVQSKVSLPGSILLTDSAQLTLQSDKAAKDYMTSMDSTIGKVLGLTSQLAQGIFEIAPAAAADAAARTQGLFQSSLGQIGDNLGAVGASLDQPKSDRMIYVAVAIVVLLLFLIR